MSRQLVIGDLRACSTSESCSYITVAHQMAVLLHSWSWPRLDTKHLFHGATTQSSLGQEVKNTTFSETAVKIYEAYYHGFTVVKKWHLGSPITKEFGKGIGHCGFCLLTLIWSEWCCLSQCWARKLLRQSLRMPQEGGNCKHVFNARCHQGLECT